MKPAARPKGRDEPAHGSRRISRAVTLGSDWGLQIEEVYAFRGEADRAFEWLERVYVQRDSGLSLIKDDPLLKNLERDPRYAAFLKKMGLP